MRKAIKTTVDGIDFRSRTEAAWYVVLRAYGLDPVYEPATYELCTHGTTPGKPDHRSCLYMPDFAAMLNGCRVLVEVKASTDGESQDIAKACILGYSNPTLIIVGWPLHYRAVLIDRRTYGSPAGEEYLFRSTLRNAPCVSQHGFVFLSQSFPDEDWLVMSDEDIRQHLLPKHRPAPGTLEGDIVREAWNRTQWKP